MRLRCGFRSYHAGLIDIAEIAVLLLQLDDIIRRLGWSKRSRILNDFMQRGIDIFGHTRGIAANIEVRTLLKPGEQVVRLLAHSVLDVKFFRLIP
jgi:hypothetical protein